MEYRLPEYAENDPELKRLLIDYNNGTVDMKTQEDKRQARWKDQKVEFQLILKNARNRRKVTQMELASKLQVPQTFVSKVENGNPSLETLIKVADALGCRLTLSDDIMNGWNAH
jgi:DNA-binding XRE family transcriptional regulator